MCNKTLYKAVFCAVIAGAAFCFLSSKLYVQASERSNSGKMANLSAASKVPKSSAMSPGINISPAGVGFGNQTVETTSSPIIVSIQNTGDAVLNIGSYALSGSNPSDFSIQNFPSGAGANIPVGSSTSFSVLFTPSAEGSRSAGIVFPTNVPGNPTVTVSLAGQGVAVTATPTPTPTPTVTPTPYPGGETTFTYQGKLYESGMPVTSPRDLKFMLFNDADATQVGTDIVVPNVPVNNGIFTVTLDFGEAAFSGPPRSLEIAVSLPGVNTFTALDPRQPVTAVPYSIRALNSSRADTASSADTAVTADSASNAAALGGVAASQYVQTTDARMADPREPAAGYGSYIQNQNVTPQTATSFSIDGTGSAGIFSSSAGFQIGGTPALEFGSGVWNLHVGGGSPSNTGNNLTYVGRFAGYNNTTGSANSFFGFNAGGVNTQGMSNTFLGASTGSSNTTGNWNSFVGYAAGSSNTTGIGNNFFGSQTGQSNTTGCCNSFFGGSAGILNTVGQYNVFVGEQSGNANTIGSNNTTIGANANVGSSGLSFATALGSGATVNASNTVVLGRTADAVRVPGTFFVQNLGAAAGSPVCWNGATFQLSFCTPAPAITIDQQPANKNKDGQIDSLNYGHLSTMLTNAIKEQQVQIDAQKKQIEQLTTMVCSMMPNATVCKEKK